MAHTVIRAGNRNYRWTGKHDLEVGDVVLLPATANNPEPTEARVQAIGSPAGTYASTVANVRKRLRTRNEELARRLAATIKLRRHEHKIVWRHAPDAKSNSSSTQIDVRLNCGCQISNSADLYRFADHLGEQMGWKVRVSAGFIRDPEDPRAARVMVGKKSLDNPATLSRQVVSDHEIGRTATKRQIVLATLAEIIAAAQNTPPRWHEFSGETFRGIRLTAVINALLRDEDFDNYLDRSQVPHSKHLRSMKHLLATRGII